MFSCSKDVTWEISFICEQNMSYNPAMTSMWYPDQFFGCYFDNRFSTISFEVDKLHGSIAFVYHELQ